ncbi:hypothetical protein [Streptomyces filamentosus]
MNRTNGAPVSTAATVNDVKPPLAGRNVLYVRAVDDAGNPSQPTKYLPRLYPSEATADLLKGTGDLDHSMSGSYRGSPAEDPNGDDGLPRTSRHRPATVKNTLTAHLGDIYGGDGPQDLVACREGRLWVYPGDGETDSFLKAGDALWALVGYDGAGIETAVQLSGTAWLERDVVTVQDITGDGVTDVIHRTDVSARLLLRTGKKDADGSRVEIVGNSDGVGWKNKLAIG